MKKYYWLKLKEDFFEEKYIKRLRRLPKGDTLTIIYLKMQLKSLKSNGYIQYDRLFPSYEEELALILDEEVDDIRLLLTALEKMNLIEILENDTLYMLAMQDLIGKEGTSAERVRKHREQQKALQCNSDVTSRNKSFAQCNVEIEIEKEIKIEKEKDIELDIYLTSKQTFDHQELINLYNKICVSLPKVLQLTEKRKKLISSIMKEYEICLVETVFHNAEASDFLTGRIKSKNTEHQSFKASFDWLLNKNNFIKVLENNYKNKEKEKTLNEINIEADYSFM